jgi:hypothetical protein
VFDVAMPAVSAAIDRKKFHNHSEEKRVCAPAAKVGRNASLLRMNAEEKS